MKSIISSFLSDVWLRIKSLLFNTYVGLFSTRVPTELIPLYFFGPCLSKEDTLEAFEKAANILQDLSDDYRKRIICNIKRLYIMDCKIHSSWDRTGISVMKYGNGFSDNALYVLAMLLVFSSSIDARKRDKKSTSDEINKNSFKELMVIFDKLTIDTSDMENYFRKMYPDYFC